MKTPKAFTKGYEARKAGAHPADNPYTRVQTRRDWNDGWATADQEMADEEAAAAQVRHHTVETVTQSPPTVVVQNEPPETQVVSPETPSYYYRNPVMPCPECKATAAPEPVSHKRAVVAQKSTRRFALMYCRACEHRFLLPVRYPHQG